jgi:hypothetical protein
MLASAEDTATWNTLVTDVVALTVLSVNWSMARHRLFDMRPLIGGAAIAPA